MKKTIAIALVLMLCISALSISAFAAGTMTVTAEVPADWTTAYCYYWVDGGAAASWPGIEMTKSGNNWTANIPADSNRVIITAGASGPQTLDLVVEAGKNVTVVLGAMQGGKYTASVNGVAPEAPVAPGGYYVTGSTDVFSNWAQCNEAGKMTEENGVFVKTFENVTAGAVELKVNVGSWAADWGFNGNNFAFEVAEGDTVTVTFNPATQTVSVAVNGVNVNPGTGDMSLAGVGIALLAATAGLVALVGKKKEF